MFSPLFWPLSQEVSSHHAAISEMRILKSNLYRFIFAKDFSFERKKLHPILNAAHTRRQTLSLRLTLHYLCMEYPNAENLCRIKVKKSKLCSICEDEGLSQVDNTEHNLFSCVCVAQDEVAQTMRECIFQTISKIKNQNYNSVRLITSSDIQQATLLFLNPCSAGIEFRDENVMFLQCIFPSAKLKPINRDSLSTIAPEMFTT